MDFFPSEGESAKTSGSAPDLAAPSAVVRAESGSTDVSLQRTNGTDLPNFSLDIIHLNLNVAQTMKEVQRLEVALGQFRTMAGELAEHYSTLLKTCSAADQRCQEVQTALARADAVALMHLDQLSSASALATRTETMLARAEDFSADTDRQLAAITDARNLLNRDLARAKAATPSRAEAADAWPTWVDRFNSCRMQLRAAISAVEMPTVRMPTVRMPTVRMPTVAVRIPVVHIPRVGISRRVVAAIALAVLAVVGIVGTWPDGEAGPITPPVIESRVVGTSGFQLPELPQRLTLVPEPPAEVRPSSRVSNPRAANPTGAPAAGFLGKLAIQSSPPGAAIFIDGQPAGETPLKSLRVRAGSHAIRIELAKFRRWTTAVHVPASSQTSITATLQPAPDQ
jgi:hypothetical protein